MKKTFCTLALATALMPGAVALASERTVTFVVENMTCASCPYIVKRSMAAVPGVARVDVSFTAKTATVTFDDAKTAAEAIAAASEKAGYPAKPSSRSG